MTPAPLALARRAARVNATPYRDAPPSAWDFISCRTVQPSASITIGRISRFRAGAAQFERAH